MKAITSLTTDEARRLLYNWYFWARPEQIAPASSAWDIWLILSGRGFGKTRTALEWCRLNLNTYERWNFIGRTASEVRDILIEGESGILRLSPDDERPVYKPSIRRLVWPNGAIAVLYSADEPDSLRGAQCEAFVADEFASWRFAEDAWMNLMLGFRLGERPRGVVATTPKPVAQLRKIIAMPNVVMTKGSTYDNIDNLAESFIQTIIQPYEGTRMGRQELHAEMLEDREGAIWTMREIDALRVNELPVLKKVVVGVDPGGSVAEGANETGIIVVGCGSVDGREHAFVLDDASLVGRPDEWAREVVRMFNKWGANEVVAETNYGGDMVEFTLRTVDPNLPIKRVAAKRGKQLRAEPVAALGEQRRYHHYGQLSILEDQMTNWAPGDDSPDRLDAMVYAATRAMGLDSTAEGRVRIGWG